MLNTGTMHDPNVQPVLLRIGADIRVAGTERIVASVRLKAFAFATHEFAIAVFPL